MIYTNNDVDKIDLEINQGDDHQIIFTLTDDKEELVERQIVNLYLEHVIDIVIR